MTGRSTLLSTDQTQNTCSYTVQKQTKSSTCLMVPPARETAKLTGHDTTHKD